MKQRIQKWTAIGELAGNVIARLDEARAGAAARLSPNENAALNEQAAVTGHEGGDNEPGMQREKAPAETGASDFGVSQDNGGAVATKEPTRQKPRVLRSTCTLVGKRLDAASPKRSPTAAASRRLLLADNDNHARSLSEVRT